MSESGAGTMFEIFVQAPDGAWRVEAVETAQPDVERLADRLLGRSDVAAVRVMRNRYDPATGRFHETRVLERANPAVERRTAESEPAAALLCKDWQDLYQPRVRHLISGALGDALLQWKATPYELIGDPSLAARVTGSTLIQNGAQRHALAHARTTRETPQACMVRIYNLVDRAYAALLAAAAAGGASGVGDLERAAALIQGGGEGMVRAWMWLSQLTRGEPWTGKLDRLSGALSEQPSDAVLRLYDGCVAEILAVPAVAAAVLNVAAQAPRREAVLGALDAAAGRGRVAGRLGALLAHRMLPQCRDALLDHALRELASSRRLTGGEIAAEMRAVHEIGQRLGKVGAARARAMAAELDRRAEGLARPESLGGALARLETPEDRADLLVGLARYTRPGGAGRLFAMSLEAVLDAAVRLMFAPAAAARPETAMAKLAVWQRAVVNTPVDAELRVSARLDQACRTLMHASGALERVRRAVPAPLDRAIRLYSWLTSGGVTDGASTDAVVEAIEGALREAFVPDVHVTPPPGSAPHLIGMLRLIEDRRSARQRAAER